MGYSIATEIRETVPGYDGFIVGLSSLACTSPRNGGILKPIASSLHGPRNIVKLENWKMSALNSRPCVTGQRLPRYGISINVHIYAFGILFYVCILFYFFFH